MQKALFVVGGTEKAFEGFEGRLQGWEHWFRKRPAVSMYKDIKILALEKDVGMTKAKLRLRLYVETVAGDDKATQCGFSNTGLLSW